MYLKIHPFKKKIPSDSFIANSSMLFKRFKKIPKYDIYDELTANKVNQFIKPA